MPTIEIEIDVDSLLIKELKVKDFKKPDGSVGDVKMIENERPFAGNSILIDQIPLLPLPDKPEDPIPVLREKQITILHANPTYIVIGGRIYCW